MANEGEHFDIVEAWFVWLCGHHCGIVSGRDHKNWWMSYNRLSTEFNKLKFKPAPNLSYETMSEESREIYDNLCRRGGFCDCLSHKD